MVAIHSKSKLLKAVFGICLIFCLLLSTGDQFLFAQSDISQAEQDDLGFIKNLFQDKIYRYANQEADSFFEKYPDSKLTPDVIFIKAQINVVEGKFDQALRQYTDIITRYPDSPAVEDALYFSGYLKLQLNQKNGVLDFDRLLTRFPQSSYRPKINFHKGEMDFQNEKWKSAEDNFKTVLEAEKIDDDLRLKTQHYLSWIYYFSGNVLLAKSLFFELLESPIDSAKKAKIAFQLGLEAHKNKRYDNAINWFERQLKEWSSPTEDFRSRFWIAECYYFKFKDKPETSTTEEKQKAIELFTANLEIKEPVSPLLTRYHRGWLLNALNQTSKAEKDFTWLQQNSEEYAADLELTAMRAKYFETDKKLKDANGVYTSALKYHQKKEIRNMLLISMVRNYNSLNDCKSLLKSQKQIDFANLDKEAVEIKFYSGRCHHKQKQWKAAKADFEKIPLESQYAKVVFPLYLEAFKKTREYKEGMAYLDQVDKNGGFGDHEKILLLKIDFAQSLKQWAQAVDIMLEAEKAIPAKSKDPWYLLNVARTADKVYEVYPDKKDPIHRYPLKSRKYYANLSLAYYQTAYNYLPAKEKETKLSVLDILIARHKALGNHQNVVDYYQDALKYISDKQRKDEIRLLIASILLRDLNQPQKAQAELHKIHNNGNSETHYEASTLLAELYVEGKKYVQAIKILEDLARQPIQNTHWFSTTHFRLGELYQASERWKTAITHYETVVKDNKDPVLVEKAISRSEEIKRYLEQKG